MSGNVHMLLALAQVVVSSLPTVGRAAAHRSKTVARRAAHSRAGQFVQGTGSSFARMSGRNRTEVSCPNTRCAGEGVAP